MIEYVMLAIIRALSRCVGRLTLDNAPQISEAISRNACRVAVMFLPHEAKEAFQNEVLNHLLESVWDDHKRGLSPDMMVCRALGNSLSVLFNSLELRSEYRAIGRDGVPARRSVWRTFVAHAVYPVSYWRWFLREWWAKDRFLVLAVPYSVLGLVAALWLADPFSQGVALGALAPVLLSFVYPYSVLVGRVVARARLEWRRAQKGAAR